MASLILSFLVFALPSGASSVLETNQDFFAFYSQVRKNEQEALKTDSFNYCNETMAKRFLVTVGHPLSELRQLKNSVLFQMAQVEAEKANFGGWNSSLIPTKEMKHLAFRTSVITPSSNPWLDSPDDTSVVIKDIRDVLTGDPCRYDDHKDFTGAGGTLEKLEQFRPNDDDDVTYKALTGIGSVKLCSELVPLYKIPTCTIALNAMISDMRNRGTGGQYTQPQLYVQVLGSGSYDKGLIIAALTLVDRVESGTTDSADLFSDLQQSFMKAGNAEDVAIAMTWKTIGLISTGGAAMKIRLEKLSFSKDRWQAVTALSTIAAAIPLLDNRYGAKGRLYSLPPDIDGRCDTGKSYHFWMAAYLSHKAAVETGDAESAVAAAYSAEKAYANVGNWTSRGSGLVITYSPFAPVSQIMRTDLSQAFAGAAYGAHFIKSPESAVSIDRGIAILTDASVITQPVSRSKVTFTVDRYIPNYLKWSEIFAPNRLYTEMMSGLKFAPVTQPKPVPAVSTHVACKRTEY